MNECAEARMTLGVYVLGAIDPAERSQVEAHLDSCPSCRDELASLAGLPALLGRVDEAQIRQVAGPPPELLETLLTRAAERRGRLTRWFGRSGAPRRAPKGALRWAPVAVAACLLLLVGGLFGGLVTNAAGNGDRPVAVRTVTPSIPPPSISASPAAERLSASDPSTGADAELVLYAKKWGTAAELYLAGAPYGEHCRWFAVARDGRRDQLGSWYVPYPRGYGKYTGSTMFQRDQLYSFEIVTVEGTPLLTIRA